MSQELAEKISLNKEVDEYIEKLRQGPTEDQSPDDNSEQSTWPPDAPSMKPR